VASSSVLIGTATDHTSIEHLNGLPWTVQTIDVQSVLAGQNPGASFRLRQTGSSSVVVADSQLLTGGTTYLLFIVPWTLVPGDHTGQWVTVGGPQGEYSYDASSKRASLLDRSLPNLPASVTLGIVRSIVATSPPQGLAARPPPTIHGAGSATATTSSTIDFGIMTDYLGPIARDHSDPNTGISLSVPPADAKATVPWQQAVAQCFSGAGICNRAGGTIRVSLAIGYNPQSGEALPDGSIGPTMNQDLVYVLVQTLGSCAAVGGGASGTNTPPSTYATCTALSFIDAHTGRGVSAVSGPSITDPSSDSP